MPTETASQTLIAHRPRAIWLFALLTVLLLGLDLGSKAWSFHSVGVVPVEIRLGEKGPEVRAGVPDAPWEEVQLNHQPQLLAGIKPVTLAPKVLNLQLLVNQGAVFGIGQGKRFFFIGMSLAALAVIGWYLWHSPAKARFTHAGLALILAGALGNLFDRVAFGGVRDMLHMLPGVELPFGWHWPGGVTEAYPWVFNVADVELLTGVGLLLLIGLFTKSEKNDK